MSDFIKLPVKNILKESKTTISKFCDKEYVAYINLEDSRQKIRVNTYYVQKGDTIELCRTYDRGLCNTIEEYQDLDLHYIESQAYGSWMDKMEPFKNANDLPFKDVEDQFEHFHVPCGPWLAKPKTSGKIKSAFCKKWIEKTEGFIDKKPKDLPFCKVVAAITYPDVRESQIIIFYDEEYYNSFWDRKGPYQIWTPIENGRSFAKERGIVTELPEIGYIEELNDEDYYAKSYIWFYGEWQTGMP